MSKSYEYYAGMTCDGCKGAVTRILSKIDGVQNFSADVANKKVVVTGTMNPAAVTEALQKWATASNKELRFVGETA